MYQMIETEWRKSAEMPCTCDKRKLSELLTAYLLNYRLPSRENNHLSHIVTEEFILFHLHTPTHPNKDAFILELIQSNLRHRVIL